MAKLKHDCFYGGLPKWLKAMVAYLRASPQEKTYPDYPQATREAKKKTQWNPPKANPPTIEQNPRQPVSSP